VTEGTVWSSLVVVVEPARQRQGALPAGLVRSCVGPFSNQGLDEAFGFAVGARSVGAGAQVPQLVKCTRLSPGSGSVAGAVVGHHAFHRTACSANHSRARSRNPMAVVALSSARIST
jgi:hypothetical protein